MHACTCERERERDREGQKEKGGEEVGERVRQREGRKGDRLSGDRCQQLTLKGVELGPCWQI